MKKKLKKILAEKIKRGRVTVFIQFTAHDTVSTKVEPNLVLAREYQKAFENIQQELGVEGKLVIQDFLGISDILKQESEMDDTALEKDLIQAVSLGVNSFDGMRHQEGEQLKKVMIAQMEEMKRLISEVIELCPGVVDRYRDNIRQKIEALLDGVEVDQTRVLQEVALFAEKVDVAEEIDRFKCHLQKLNEMLNQNGAIGRKIEFILQELNREVNTLASKMIDVDISQKAVDMKTELEKLREQIQNIE